MTLDRISVRYRLNLILDYLDELRPLSLLSIDELLSDRYKYRAAERLLEIIIQTALDINNHLISNLSATTTPSNADAFLEMSRLEILTPELAQNLAQSGKFRNRLAHRYDDIDPQIVYLSISEALDGYPLYIDQMTNFIASLEVEDGSEFQQ